LAPPDLTLYARVADALAREIREGLYAPGDRLPSIRDLTRRLGVSSSTVVEAYGQLLDRGLVDSRPQSGFYVRAALAGPEAPAMSRPRIAPTPVSVGEIAMDVVQATSDPALVALGSASPNLELPAARAVRRILAAAVRRAGVRALGYDVPPGHLELRKQIARRGAGAGTSLSAADVVVTSGCQEAIVLSLRAVAAPGDAIAIESPTFYGILHAIRSLGLRALEIPTHPETGIDLESLAMAIEQFNVKACVVTPHASNPLGYVMPDDRKRELLELVQSHGVPLVENDVYGDLVFAVTRPRTIQSWDTTGQVLLCSSVSKTIAPGLRVGWVVPGRYARQVRHLKLVASMGCATWPQVTVAEYLAGGEHDRHLRVARAAYRRSRDGLIECVARRFPQGTKVTHPAGGFVAWVELPRATDAVDLYRQALAAGISIAPGSLFSAREKYRRFVRLSFAHGSTPAVVRALEKVGDLACAIERAGRPPPAPVSAREATPRGPSRSPRRRAS
jgi:DNA-binding transcriptional MocR family regulator